MMDSVTVYISAGGRGTRLNGLFQPDPMYGITKALLRPAGGLTLVEHQIECLRMASPANIVVNTGDHPHLARYIQSVYPDPSVVCAVGTPVQLESGGELLSALRSNPDSFTAEVLVVNVDTLLTLPLQELVATHRRCGADLTITLTELPGVPNENAFWVGADGLVLYDAELASNARTIDEAAQHAVYRASSAGAMVVNTAFLQEIVWGPEDGKLSLYRDIMREAVETKRAYAYNNGRNPFMDVGTAETWLKVAQNPVLVDEYLRYC